MRTQRIQVHVLTDKEHAEIKGITCHQFARLYFFNTRFFLIRKFF